MESETGPAQANLSVEINHCAVLHFNDITLAVRIRNCIRPARRHVFLNSV